MDFAPGPVRIAFDNRSRRRVLPVVWAPNAAFHEAMVAAGAISRRRARSLTKPSATSIEMDPRFRASFKITSLTFLFTDLRGSTALYDRVGDLAAYDLVRSHSAR